MMGTRHDRGRRKSDGNSKDIRIVYEDRWLIVIDKPSGLLTMSAGREGEETAYSILTDYVRNSKPGRFSSERNIGFQDGVTGENLCRMETRDGTRQEEQREWHGEQRGWNGGQGEWNGGQGEWNGGQRGWNEGQRGWNEGQRGWNEGQRGWHEGQRGWHEGQRGWHEGQRGWHEGQRGWHEGQRGWHGDWRASRGGRGHMERPRIFIVHRIDRNTSGLLVFAKDPQTKEALQENWNNAVIARRYVAAVEGCPRKSEGTVTSWLTEDPRTLKMYSCPRDNGGQKAVTHFKVLGNANGNGNGYANGNGNGYANGNGNANGNGYSLVEFELETGRKNQIRVHCADMGCPVAGDGKYGAATNPIGRLALHARTLEFIHPWTGKTMSFTTPVPARFRNLCR